MRHLSARIRFAMLAVLGVSLSATAQAPDDFRLALVIGNSGYSQAPLSNPANDARAMTRALEAMGFTVIEARDASRARMEGAIVQMRDALKGKHGVGMLYYAGHGLQLDWRNYMVPVDARLSASADVPQQTIDVQTVLAAFAASGNRVNIVVLDACRDNPFKAGASGRGLAQIDAPTGTFLAYATAPGNVAEDGDGSNSLYTGALVQELARDAPIEDVFKRVRMKVRQGTAGRQIPWEATSLEDDFRFAAATGGAGAPATAGTSTSGAPVGTPPGFDAQKAAWDAVRTSSDAAQLFAFLDRYPGGEIGEMAVSRLNQLQKPQITASVGKGQAGTLAYTGPRFKVGDSWTFRIVDRFNEQPIRSFTRRVVGIDGDVVRLTVSNFNTYRTDLLGGTVDLTVDGKTVTYDPPAEPDPAEFYIGRKWQGESRFVDFDGVAKTQRISSRIVGSERIVLPAGTFDAFVVDLSIAYSDGRYEEVRKWVDPRYGMSIRRDITGRVGGKIVRHERRELVALSAQRS